MIDTGGYKCHMYSIHTVRSRGQLYNCTYERQYACIHIVRVYTGVCMQSGQSQFPLPDCVCVYLSDKQHVTQNS